jgi:hypothetical protein
VGVGQSPTVCIRRHKAKKGLSQQVSTETAPEKTEVALLQNSEVFFVFESKPRNAFGQNDALRG